MTGKRMRTSAGTRDVLEDEVDATCDTAGCSGSRVRLSEVVTFGSKPAASSQSTGGDGAAAGGNTAFSAGCVGDVRKPRLWDRRRRAVRARLAGFGADAHMAGCHAGAATRRSWAEVCKCEDRTMVRLPMSEAGVVHDCLRVTCKGAERRFDARRKDFVGESLLWTQAELLETVLVAGEPGAMLHLNRVQPLHASGGQCGMVSYAYTGQTRGTHPNTHAHRHTRAHSHEAHTHTRKQTLARAVSLARTHTHAGEGWRRARRGGRESL